MLWVKLWGHVHSFNRTKYAPGTNSIINMFDVTTATSCLLHRSYLFFNYHQYYYNFRLIWWKCYTSSSNLIDTGVKTDPWVMLLDITSASLKLSYLVYAFLGMSIALSRISLIDICHSYSRKTLKCRPNVHPNINSIWHSTGQEW